MLVLTIAATPFFANRGSSMRIYTEAKYLQKLGAQVRIVTYHNGESIPELDIRRIGEVKWYKKLIPGFSWGKVWLALKLLFLSISEIKRFNPDVIHAHQYEGLTIGYLAKCLSFRWRLKIVADIQGDLKQEFASYNAKQKIVSAVFVFLARRFIFFADAVITSGERAEAAVRAWVGGRMPVAVVADGVDEELFENPKLACASKSEFLNSNLMNWCREAKILLYTGGMSNNKGVGELLRVFAEGQKSGRIVGWRLLLAGYGEQSQEYESYIAKEGLERFIKRVDFTYFDLFAICDLATVAIDPKSGGAEGSGKIMNYMAAGLPIICFDNEFNRARLGAKGLYINKLDEFIEMLKRNGFSRVTYELKKWGAETQVKKLYNILHGYCRG